MKRLTKEDVEREITALDDLQIKDLRQRWRDVYNTEPPPRIQSGLLRLAVAYRIQEKAFGGLKASSKRQMKAHLEAMVHSRSGDAGPRPKPPIRLSPGTQLMREWNGSTLLVDVVDGGFLWKDTTYRTLSAVAVAITGTKWSGPKFFGLVQGGVVRKRSGTVGQ